MPPKPPASALVQSQLVAPVSRAEPAEPVAVTPTEQAPRPAPAQRRPPTRRLEPGDLVCGECGEGNPAIRKFCSRCGTTLAAATVVRRRWWQRIVPRRRPKVHEAGSRPGRGGVRRKGRQAAVVRRIFPTVRAVLAVALLLGGILYSVYPPFRGELNGRMLAARQNVEARITPHYSPVRPIGVTATAELPDHPAGAVADGFSNTFWLAPGEGTQPAVVFTFARPVDIRRAILRIGNPDKFQTAHRPQQLHLVFSNGRTTDVTATDTPDPQEVDIEGGVGSTIVEVHVQSMYRSLNGTDVALAEIEFFERD